MNILYLALVFLIPFFLGKLDCFPIYLFMELFCFAFILFIFIQRNASQKAKLKTHPIFLSLIAYFLILLISFSLSLNKSESLRELSRLILVIIFYFLSINILNKNNFLTVIKTIVFSNFFIAAYGILIYIYIADPNYLIFSTFFNSNELAGFLIVCFPILVYSFFTEFTKEGKIKAISIITLVSACIILTLSRAALMALLFSIIPLFVLYKNKINFRWKKIVVIFYYLPLIALLFVTKPIFKERLFSVFNLHHRSPLFRELVYKSSIYIVKENPMGTGVGTFGLIYPMYKLGGSNTLMTHNTLLQQACENGYLGFFGWLFLFLSGYLLTVKNIKRNNPFAYFSLWGQGAFFLHNLFDYTFNIEATFLLYLFLVIAGTKDYFLKEENKIIKYCYLKILSLIILIIFYSPLMIASYFFEKVDYLSDKLKYKNIKLAYYKKALIWNPHYSEYFGKAGDFAINNNLLKDAENFLKQAISLYNFSPFYHYDLAMIYLRQGKEKSALNELLITISLHPRYTSALRELASFYFFKKNYQQAEKYLIIIINISKNKYESDIYQPIPFRLPNQDFINARKLLAIINFSRKENKKGIALLIEAQDYLWQKAEVYKQTGETKKYKTTLSEIIQTFPYSAQAKKAEGELHLLK